MSRKISNIALIFLLGLYYNSLPVLWFSYSTFAQSTFATHCINPSNSKCQGKCQIFAMESKSEKPGQKESVSVKLPQFHPPLPELFRQSARVSTTKVFLSHPEKSISQGIYKLPFHPPKNVV